MKKETGMTYDSLMNHFVNYPNHPEWLHKLFSPLTVMFISASLFIFLSYVVFDAGLWISIVFAIVMLYVYSRTISAMYNMSGHGVGLNPKRTSKVRKILIVGLIILSILISIVLIGGFYGYDKYGNILLVLLPGALALSLIGSILIWKYHMYFVTWYGSEYDARIEYKSLGVSEQDIDIAIKNLREKGILPAASEEG